MLRRLAADQCTVGLHTALCHTTDDCCDLLRIVLATCNIVKEEQRLSAGTGNVIHTHRYGVNTDRIMLIQKKCQLHLRAAAIGTRKKHRLLHLFDLRQRKCARKASQSTEYFFTHCPLYMLFHKLHRTVTSFNVHSCLFVIHFLLLNKPYIRLPVILRPSAPPAPSAPARKPSPDPAAQGRMSPESLLQGYRHSHRH